MSFVIGIGSFADIIIRSGGVNWGTWFDHFWQAKGAANYAASLLDLVGAANLVEGNSEATRMANNLVVRTDPAGNIKPDKEKSTEKIDGVVAMVMALDRALRHEPPRRSVYEERGLETV